jgi:hypothetical protein
VSGNVSDSVGGAGLRKTGSGMLVFGNDGSIRRGVAIFWGGESVTGLGCSVGVEWGCGGFDGGSDGDVGGGSFAGWAFGGGRESAGECEWGCGVGLGSGGIQPEFAGFE